MTIASEKLKHYNHEYYLAHKDKIKEQAKNWQAKNKERASKIYAKWRKTHREEINAKSRERYADAQLKKKEQKNEIQ